MTTVILLVTSSDNDDFENNLSQFLKIIVGQTDIKCDINKWSPQLFYNWCNYSPMPNFNNGLAKIHLKFENG